MSSYDVTNRYDSTTQSGDYNAHTGTEARRKNRLRSDEQCARKADAMKSAQYSTDSEDVGIEVLKCGKWITVEQSDAEALADYPIGAAVEISDDGEWKVGKVVEPSKKFRITCVFKYGGDQCRKQIKDPGYIRPRPAQCSGVTPDDTQQTIASKIGTINATGDANPEADNRSDASVPVISGSNDGIKPENDCAAPRKSPDSGNATDENPKVVDQSSILPAVEGKKSTIAKVEPKEAKLLTIRIGTAGMLATATLVAQLPESLRGMVRNAVA